MFKVLAAYATDIAMLQSVIIAAYAANIVVLQSICFRVLAVYAIVTLQSGRNFYTLFAWTHTFVL